MLNKLTGFTGTIAGAAAFILIMWASVGLTPTDHPLRVLGFFVGLGAFVFLVFKGVSKKPVA